MCSCCCCQLSLFFDVLLALCVGMTEQRFIERGLLSAAGDVANDALVRSARRLVWRQLSGFTMKAGLFCVFCLRSEIFSSILCNIFSV